MTKEAYIGLGSNIEPRARHLVRAVHRLDSQPFIRVDAVSPVFSSEALTREGEEQPDFLNAVVRVETMLDPHSMLDACLRIERELGRERASRGWAPRTIDLDLLVYTDQVIESETLTVPHPR
ncbi:MAG: 2-amino-4-hydroxy-6-hydroxymethyldihydropteridine diphosphokinase, partial [Rhodothermia bacterium]|nr:2-amino-4-hydroxy-6-hydroxymethyldihydropteridine diphosphokinase [Rhodothermia bacterium]